MTVLGSSCRYDGVGAYALGVKVSQTSTGYITSLNLTSWSPLPL